MKRRARIIALLLAATLVSLAPDIQTVAAQDTQEQVEDYPDLPGRDESFGFCTGCHNFKLVAAQGMSREAWNDTLDWMVKRHGMADIQGEPRDLILDYLATAFPAQRRTAPGGWQNPFAQ
jgi:hypothetical protein